MKKVRVIYIAGHGRSGSTILGDVLGSAVNTVHLGEVSHIILTEFATMHFVAVERRSTIVRGGAWFPLRCHDGCSAN